MLRHSAFFPCERWGAIVKNAIRRVYNKHAFTLFCLAVMLSLSSVPRTANGQSVTSVSVVATSHSYIEYALSYSGSPSSVRTRVAVAPATCTSGTGGWVIQSDYANENIPLNPVFIAVTGLSPSTNYNLCPEITSNGSTWNGGVAASATTSALPPVHPALPIAPLTSVTTPPNINAGYDYTTNTSVGAYNVVNIQTQTDCNNLQQTYFNAVANQVHNGTVIKFAPGLVCTNQVSLQQSPTSGYFPGDVIIFGSSAVNTSSSTLTLPNHGFTEGQQIIFSTWYSTLPSTPAGNIYAESPNGNVNTNTAIASGWRYYAHVIDANTIQVYSGASQSNGGTLMQFTNQGYGSQMMVFPWPRHLNWIVTCPSTSTCGSVPETTFVPQGTRLQGPQVPATSSTAPVSWQPTYPTTWLPKMGTIQMPSNHQYGPNDGTNLFEFSAWDTGAETPNANMYFIGMRFTYQVNPEIAYKLSTDPWPREPMIVTQPWNQNIIFDRVIFDAPEYDKVKNAFWWQGSNQTIVNSWISGMHYWHGALHNLDGSYGNGTALALGGQGSNELTISPGTYNYAYDSVTLPKQVTVSLSGAATAASNAWVYFSTDKQLNIELPSGLTGTCAGYSPCNVFSLPTTAGNGVYSSSSTNSFPTTVSGQNSLHPVSPVFSSSSSCSSPVSLFQNQTDPTVVNLAQTGGFATGNFTLGTTFYSDQSGYICGVTFYKSSQDPATSHTIDLWSSTGTKLAEATTSSETASGWQSGYFASPVAITTGTDYVATYFTTAGVEYVLWYYNNRQLYNSPLHAPGVYIPSNGAWNYSDNWPSDFWGTSGVVRIGGAYFSAASAQIASIANNDPFSDPWNTEGCQCMIGGIGPGPYAYVNNYGEMSGTAWHHDDTGGTWAYRGDFTYVRNYDMTPGWALIGTSQSNGTEYNHRHIHEWKSGPRINFSGNIIGGGLLEDTPIGDCIEFAGLNGAGMTDVSITNNTWAHCGFGLSGPYMIAGFIQWPHPPFPTARILFQNNLVWDINGQTWCAHPGPNTNGWGFCNGTYSVGAWGTQLDMFGAEDYQVKHNTFVYPQSQGSDFIWWGGPGVMEGIQVTDNILFVNQGAGINSGFDSSGTCGPGGTDSNCFGSGTYCNNYSGLSQWTCATENSPLNHNVMTGGITQSAMQSLWGGTGNYMNYIPADPTNPSAVGWFNYHGLTSALNDYHLKANYCSGCGSPASDGTDVGANMDALNAAEGITTLVGVSSITSSSVQVNFVAPDSQSCPVDYSAADSTLTSSFTRATDTGSARVRNLTISGLATHTHYYFRVNCAVQQPVGQFTTN